MLASLLFLHRNSLPLAATCVAVVMMALVQRGFGVNVPIWVLTGSFLLALLSFTYHVWQSNRRSRGGRFQWGEMRWEFVAEDAAEVEFSRTEHALVISVLAIWIGALFLAVFFAPSLTLPTAGLGYFALAMTAIYVHRRRAPGGER